MPRYAVTHYNRRTSGRDLLAVRRRGRPVRIVGDAAPPDLTQITKAELQAQAEAAGLAVSGTKAEIAERLAGSDE